MSYGSGGGWDGPGPDWSGQDPYGYGQGGYYDQGSYDDGEQQRSGPSGGVLAMIAVVAVLAAALLGVIVYLAVDSGGSGSPVAAPPTSDAPAWSTPPTTSRQQTTTVTRTTTRTQTTTSRLTTSTPSDSYPAGADRSGWISDRNARCNAGDPAAMIGRTTRSRFSICINPDNGRYYYRGSSGGLGVEVDDPEVYGNSATVRNQGVEYVITSQRMVIYERGREISDQAMLEYWTR
ncbi:hypothetical protein [Dietzia sp. 179-F 9C3 NHS]|uniref:hypothetical protein n=1 Tax=Dietzia sp. 179-F 9C3 NHS TaxID=3374295 RepID=UPI003879DB73